MNLDIRKRLKTFKKLTKSLYNHRYLLYAFYNTIGVNAIDIPAMQIIDNSNAWKWYHSSGWIPYIVAFNFIRILPILLYCVKCRSKREFLNFLEVFFWTLPLEDGIHYALRGRNPISPFNNYHYPFPWGDEHVAEFYGRNFGMAGIFSLVKRKLVSKIKDSKP